MADSAPSEKEASQGEQDQVIAAIGPWGPWQRRNVVLLGLTTMLATWPTLITTFMAAPVDYWCARTEPYLDMDVEAWRQMSSPEVVGSGLPDRCHVWAAFSDASVNNKNDNNASSSSRAPSDAENNNNSGDNRSIVACSKWEHDRSVFRRTTAQDWDLVCDRESYQNMAQTTFFAGMLVGTLLVGILSDRYGRRVTLVPCCLMTVAVGIALPFSADALTFVTLRFFHGMSKIGVFVLSFVWSMEVVGDKWQTYVGMGMEFPWVMAWMMLSGMGYLWPDWRVLQWATSLPGVVTVALWWLIPESPKWLLTKGRLEEAEVVVKQAAKRNGRILPEGWKLQPLNLNNNRLHEERGSFCDLFSHRNLVVRTVVIFLNWFANSFVYYGLTLNSGDLGGSYQLNFFVNGVLELPAYSLSLYVILKGGRRVPYMVLIAVGALALLSTTLVERDAYPHNWPVVALAMVGKFCITGTFGIIYVYSAEVFPTVVRSVGVGTASVFARLGGAVAPHVASLGRTVTPTFPIAVFGLTALAAGSAVLLLPETKDMKLPDTLEEGNKVVESNAGGENIIKKKLKKILKKKRAQPGEKEKAVAAAAAGGTDEERVKIMMA